MLALRSVFERNNHNDEQREAFETIIRYLDGISIAVPSDVQQYLDEIRENADAAVTQSASAALAAAMTDPEKYIHDNKEILEQYRAVTESEEYKASPAYRLQEYLKQFQKESGYNDVFISAMQRLSPAYCEYHKSLQAANEVFFAAFPIPYTMLFRGFPHNPHLSAHIFLTPLRLTFTPQNTVDVPLDNVVLP